MSALPYIDIHTHPYHQETDTITVQNIYPGDGFSAFLGRNFYSVGLHPWHVKSKEENNQLLQMVEDALEFDHVIFIGECGLDKNIEIDFEEQKRVFHAQAFMAEEFGKPLIVHCVKAYNEVLELHKDMHPEMPWILHGYNGSIQLTKQLLERGILFSFGDKLFNDKAKAVDAVKILPLNNVFLETDEFDGEVSKMYQRLAMLRNVDVELIKKQLWDNFNRIENRLLSRGDS